MPVFAPEVRVSLTQFLNFATKPPEGKAFCTGKSDHEQTTLLRAQARSFVSLYRDL